MRNPYGDQVIVPEEPNAGNGTDYTVLIVSLLGFLKLALNSFGIAISDELIDGIVDFAAAAAVLYGIVKRLYLTKEARRKKDVLHQVGLKE